MLIKKIPDTNCLVTNTVLNTKISEVEKKIPNTSNLVTAAVKLRINFLIILNTSLLKKLLS